MVRCSRLATYEWTSSHLQLCTSCGLLLLRKRDLKNLIWMVQTLSSLLSARTWMDLGQTWCSLLMIVHVVDKRRQLFWQLSSWSWIIWIGHVQSFDDRSQIHKEKHSARVMAYPQPLGSWSWSGLARQKDIPEIVTRDWQGYKLCQDQVLFPWRGRVDYH